MTHTTQTLFREFLPVVRSVFNGEFVEDDWRRLKWASQRVGSGSQLKGSDESAHFQSVYHP